VASQIWLFSDTLVGALRSNGSRRTSCMPRNSLAHFATDASTGSPAPKAVLRHFQPTIAHDDTHTGFFTPANESNWYWTQGGGLMRDGGKRLVVLAGEMWQRGGGQWGFSHWGTDSISVEVDPTIDPLRWKQHIVKILPSVFGPDSPWTLGSAVVDSGDGFIYLFGYDPQKHALLFRIDQTSFDAQVFEMLTVRVSSAMGLGEWVPAWLPLAPLFAVRLFPNAPTETTVTWHPFMRRWYVLAINSFESDQLQLRTAERLDGPWSNVADLLTIPELSQRGNKDVFCYSPKAHPEFQQKENEIVLSYMCNAGWDHVQWDPELYVPRLVRVTISKKGDAEVAEAVEMRELPPKEIEKQHTATGSAEAIPAALRVVKILEEDVPAAGSVPSTKGMAEPQPITPDHGAAAGHIHPASRRHRPRHWRRTRVN